jgi:hypothetical protein
MEENLPNGTRQRKTFHLRNKGGTERCSGSCKFTGKLFRIFLSRCSRRCRVSIRDSSAWLHFAMTVRANTRILDSPKSIPKPRFTSPWPVATRKYWSVFWKFRWNCRRRICANVWSPCPEVLPSNSKIGEAPNLKTACSRRMLRSILNSSSGRTFASCCSFFEMIIARPAKSADNSRNFAYHFRLSRHPPRFWQAARQGMRLHDDS